MEKRDYNYVIPRKQGPMKDAIVYHCVLKGVVIPGRIPDTFSEVTERMKLFYYTNIKFSWKKDNFRL